MITTIQLKLENVSSEQLRKMRHALGLDQNKNPYRNYYFVKQPDNDWEDLVNKGFAKKSSDINNGSIVYYLTFEAVKIVFGKGISKKNYDKL